MESLFRKKIFPLNFNALGKCFQKFATYVQCTPKPRFSKQSPAPSTLYFIHNLDLVNEVLIKDSI